MKKFYKIFIYFLIFTIFNAKAEICNYEIDGVDHSLIYSVNSYILNWKYSYSITNEYLFSTSSNGISGIKVFLPNDRKNKIFSDFNVFGFPIQEGACPVLVDIGDGYTMIPYKVFLDYFNPNEVLNCEECDEDIIQSPRTKFRYTFESICATFLLMNPKRLAPGRQNYVESPLLRYMYHKNGDIAEACKNYLLKGMNRDKKLHDYLTDYPESFIIGKKGSTSEDVCPLYDKKNNTSEILDCLNEKAKSIKSSMDNFKNVCSENEMKAIQSYAGGSTERFYSKKSVSAYLNNEIKLLFSNFSSECGAAADVLYEKINNFSIVLYSYSNISDFTNKLSYMYFESKYLEAYNLLTSRQDYVKIEKDTCKLVSDGVTKIIIEIVNAVKIGALVIVIFLSIVEIYKAFIAGDESSKNKMPSFIIKRIILLILILMLPVIISILLEYLNKFIPVDSSKCVVDELS